MAVHCFHAGAFSEPDLTMILEFHDLEVYAYWPVPILYWQLDFLPSPEKGRLFNADIVANPDLRYARLPRWPEFITAELSTTRQLRRHLDGFDKELQLTVDSWAQLLIVHVNR